MQNCQQKGSLITYRKTERKYLARKTYMVMCCFCTAENFVQVEVWAPNKQCSGLLCCESDLKLNADEFNSR